MTEQLEHFKANQETFKVWIDTNARLQASHDLLTPLIPTYERETKTAVLACQDCLIDMLIWYSIQLKNETQEQN